MYLFIIFIIITKGIQRPLNSITITKTSIQFSSSIDKLSVPHLNHPGSSFILSAKCFPGLLLSYFVFCFQFVMLSSIRFVIHTQEALLILLLFMIFIIFVFPYNLHNSSFVLTSNSPSLFSLVQTFFGIFSFKNANFFFYKF